MIINNTYVKHLTLEKSNNTRQVNSNKPTNTSFKPSVDKVSLSDAALAKMNGVKSHDLAPTYVKPKTARSMIAAHQVKTETTGIENKDNRFKDMMQAILDKRLGIDRDKLAELDAMIEEISKNENMSPEEKQKAIEQLDKMKEDLIKESIEMKKVAKQSFHGNEDDK